MTTHHFVATSFHNVIGTIPAALKVASGDIVITRTIDAAGYDEEDVQRATGPNPMIGPIFVEGAEPGDSLRVEILEMTPTRDIGFTRSVVAANVIDPETVRDLPRSDKTLWEIDRQAMTVRLKEPVAGIENLVLPLSPMVGCFGVAPSLGQAISTATSGEHGGNMDYRVFGPGTTVWFPIFSPGALFFLGDCHAIQGDGEIVGTGVETTFEVTVRLSVEKAKPMSWPRAETADDIITVGNARPLDQALQHATTEMLTVLITDYKLTRVAASHLLGQVVRYDIGNVFDPAYTVACRVAKKWLPSR
ncbi:acetamidase/formamidase protein [Rhizobium gallicum bv. gallicum R602sp]|uniref:Acetamidase/formamidase protein n=1 Tax=Rhizobium gallicum bv. gallicum R602sp TaxID=1041138 RepID=A0A0B4X599_9HYPH|nr:acetamidase/formamidase family protein [Rhizobium gallicum]AJD41682.1 acetamidase/formamidase protein [Rhizobium gallicum bv. gallicum R602sp]